MSYTFRDILDVILPSIPPALIEPQEIPQLRHKANYLLPTMEAGFELRLADAQPQVDLYQVVFPSAREHLIPYMTDKFLSDFPQKESLWPRLTGFMQYWADHSADLDNVFGGFSLEPSTISGSLLDPVAYPEPLLGFIFGEAATYSGKLEALLNSILRHLMESERVSGVLADLKRYLPDPETGATVRLFGILFGREQNLFRYYIRNFHVQSLIPYLESRGWQGDIEEFREIATWLSSYNKNLDVNLDIRETVGTRVGIKVFPSDYGHNDPHLALLLDDLVKRGLCAPQKRDALQNQHVLLTPLKRGVSWPDHLILESLMRPTSQQSAFHIYLSHIKLIYSPGEPLTAKAYLAFRHVWDIF